MKTLTIKFQATPTNYTSVQYVTIGEGEVADAIEIDRIWSGALRFTENFRRDRHLNERNYVIQKVYETVDGQEVAHFLGSSAEGKLSEWLRSKVRVHREPTFADDLPLAAPPKKSPHLHNAQDLLDFLITIPASQRREMEFEHGKVTMKILKPRTGEGQYRCCLRKVRINSTEE